MEHVRGEAESRAAWRAWQGGGRQSAVKQRPSGATVRLGAMRPLTCRRQEGAQMDLVIESSMGGDVDGRIHTARLGNSRLLFHSRRDFDAGHQPSISTSRSVAFIE